MEEALQVMTSSHLPALPVVDDKNHFHGILSQQKLIEKLKAIDQEKTELLKKEVSVSDRFKEEFVKNISHEIRTPLNAIQGLSEILIYSDISKEDKEEFASLLHAKTDELLSVVDSLIDLSQLQTGDIDFTPTDQINPERFCREIEEKARKIRSSYKKNHIELICSPRIPENFQFQTSLAYLQQVMLHLINNAIKFTEEGKIEFGCYQKEQGQVGFFVKDTGLGIEPEKQNIIFKAFEKAWSKEYHIYPGMGLGLTIASKVIEAAGGHIWFESKQNEGTAFYFWLPQKT
jgi:signal transduction histidine kinase